MDLGGYSQGAIVWVPALSHAGTGAEVNPTSCAGKYYKVGTVVSTPLIFNQFDSETGVYYAIIDTAPLSVGVYMVLVEELIAGVNKNAMHVFQVTAAGAAGLTVTPVTTGDCLSVAEIKTMIDTSAYTDTQLQIALDWAFGQITGYLGHAFGRAFRIYHDAGTGSTAATITVDSTKVSLIITDGANAGTHDFTFAANTTVGDLVVNINNHAVGFIAELLDVVPYEQPSANLKTLSATSVYGYANRISLQFKQWTECHDGNNSHNVRVRIPIRSIVSVIEDGITLTPGTDYYVYKLWVERLCCAGYPGACYVKAYWSCAGICNVCITYIPRFFGMCPTGFAQALLGFVQGWLQQQAAGTYSSEQIGDYRYSIGGAGTPTGLNSYFSSYLNLVYGAYHVAPIWSI